MAIQFPSNPELSQEYSYEGKTWTYNGRGWNRNSDNMSSKQDTLYDQVNIKTINGQSILGSGDLLVGNGGVSLGGDMLKSTYDTPPDGVPFGTVNNSRKLDGHTADYFLSANGSIDGGSATKVTYDSKGLIIKGEDATCDDILDGIGSHMVSTEELNIIRNTSNVNTGDQTLDGLGGVPNTRTINGKPLSSDITLNQNDIGVDLSSYQKILSDSISTQNQVNGSIKTINGISILNASELDNNISIVGEPGADGSVILGGQIDPTVLVGNVGDLYLNTTTHTIFGPKTSDGWGIGMDLDGSPGVGIKSGGTTGQVLAKNSNLDYDTIWVNQSGGSGVDQIQSDWNQTNVDAKDYIKNKPELPPSNAERNIIIGIQKNGSDLDVDIDRKVNITVPTQPSDIGALSYLGDATSYGNADVTGSIYSDYAWSDQDGNNIKNTYATKSEIPNISTKADLVNGTVPASQLPSYVDDIIELLLISATSPSGSSGDKYYNSSTKKILTYTTSWGSPSDPESGKIYITLNDNLTYRWSGSNLIEVSKSLTLGETESTAYRGDRGKAAYDHSQITHDKSFVGLGNVDNTSDLNKPISTATQSALDKKQTVFTGICQEQYLTENDIVIDNSALTLTIATVKNGQAISANNPICFYTDGSGVSVKHTKSTPAVFNFTNTTGVWYFYFNSSGDPIATQSGWDDFSIIATVFRFYWNANLPIADKCVIQSVEYHKNDISWVDHAWKHNEGTKYLTGFEISHNRLASGAPAADGSNAVVALSTGTNIDDNLHYTISNSTNGTKFSQNLGTGTLPATSGKFICISNDSSGRLEKIAATDFPFLWNQTTNVPQYLTTTGVRTDISNGNFFVYYLYALQEPRPGESIKIKSAETTFSTAALAAAHSWEQLQTLFPTLKDNEIRLLYKLTFEYRTSYAAGSKYSVLRTVDDLRKQKITTTSVASGNVPATSVIFSPSGNISSTNVQSAIEELDNEKVAKNGTDRLINEAEATKLSGIATGAQVNVIESISVSGVAQTITNKNVDLTSSTLRTAVNNGAYSSEVVSSPTSGTLTLKNWTETFLNGILTNSNSFTVALPTPVSGLVNESILVFKIDGTLPTITQPSGIIYRGSVPALAINTNWTFVYEQIYNGSSWEIWCSSVKNI